MKIKTTQNLLNLEGEPLKTSDMTPLTVGKALSDILLGAKTGGKMKMFVLARKFFEEEDVDLDESDVVLLTKTIESHEPGYTNLVTGQLLMILENK